MKDEITEYYYPEDWIELNNLISHMDNEIKEQDSYEIEGHELDILKMACRYIKAQQGIFTGKQITESPMTGEKYEVNIWTIEGDGLIHALSKRKIEDAET